MYFAMAGTLTTQQKFTQGTGLQVRVDHGAFSMEQLHRKTTCTVLDQASGSTLPPFFQFVHDKHIDIQQALDANPDVISNGHFSSLLVKGPDGSKIANPNMQAALSHARMTCDHCPILEQFRTHAVDWMANDHDLNKLLGNLAR